MAIRQIVFDSRMRIGLNAKKRVLLQRPSRKLSADLHFGREFTAKHFFHLNSRNRLHRRFPSIWGSGEQFVARLD
jgi:hypothetical protein